ncbi:MAG: hypothetical protein FJW39_22100 [Acidobacteria bacterium]|nr:hypothetical protein [Acidobacteriota bacterium]
MLKASAQASLAGRIVKETFAGTYTVDSACTFSMSYTVGLLPDRWKGMIIDNGGGAYVMHASPAGAAVAGTLSAMQ